MTLSKLKAHATKIKAIILIAFLFCVAAFLSFYFRPYYGELIYEEWLAGYFGYGDGISTCVRVTSDINLQMLLACAQACGYNATYRSATLWLRSPEEYCSVVRCTKNINIIYNRGGNETTFNHAIPTWALIDCDYNPSEYWFESRLREFFPHLTNEEVFSFAKKLASGYTTVKIPGIPDWQSVKNYMGAFSYVHSVPINYLFEHHSKGRIGYEMPSVTIRQVIVLNENKSVTFVISANSQGFAAINVDSKYFLNINWIRLIFAKMFLEVGLPIIGFFRFTITENWIGTFA